MLEDYQRLSVGIYTGILGLSNTVGRLPEVVCGIYIGILGLSNLLYFLHIFFLEPKPLRWNVHNRQITLLK